MRGLWRGLTVTTEFWIQGNLSSYHGVRQYIEGTSLYKVIPETVTESIGQRDRSLKPIFEGDIVETKYGRLCKVVRKTTPYFNGWDLVPIEGEHKIPDKYDLWDSKNLLVVGNVFEGIKASCISQQIWL